MELTYPEHFGTEEYRELVINDKLYQDDRDNPYIFHKDLDRSNNALSNLITYYDLHKDAELMKQIRTLPDNRKKTGSITNKKGTNRFSVSYNGIRKQFSNKTNAEKYLASLQSADLFEITKQVELGHSEGLAMTSRYKA
jgi:hypothetical protein